MPRVPPNASVLPSVLPVPIAASCHSRPGSRSLATSGSYEDEDGEDHFKDAIVSDGDERREGGGTRDEKALCFGFFRRCRLSCFAYFYTNRKFILCARSSLLTSEKICSFGPWANAWYPGSAAVASDTGFTYEVMQWLPMPSSRWQSPYDPDLIQSSDLAIVSELKRVSELRHSYFDKHFIIPNPTCSQSALAAQIEEQCNLMKAYQITMNKFEDDLKFKDSVFSLLQSELSQKRITEPWSQSCILYPHSQPWMAYTLLA
ncbi:hypothetical protein B296_00030666 [Ensete ventricosum]|uniref:DUF641 domain-containing protein n=1 Tax=Ensete ventricosum TaxID=4639 RepID=A0A426ZWT3_ENSVE|nr:hypothetical protein B296_00030666 [Ensete ventricosum]